jgi:2-polyprenyl-3-methyl-5-hydroxy-6-metoxy-1,4-benzoquinol methylase
MDDPSLDVASHRRALRGLMRINRISRTAAAVARPIFEMARRDGVRSLRVLDVASGAGDVVMSLADLARRQDIPIEVEGCDISDTAIDFAREIADRRGTKVRFFTCDALHDGLPGGYDVVMCNLFLHHLADDDAVRLLRTMRDAATRMVLVNDLERRIAGYWFTAWGTRVISRSPVVHVDAVRSVRAAFTLDEARDMARRAELHDAQVRRIVPFRWLLTSSVTP